MARAAVAQRANPVINLLLVEDNASDAFLLSSLLDDSMDSSYSTLHVKTQSAAIAALKHRNFDVCILDLMLPDASGFSALVTIQQAVPDMPVLILTGVNDTSLARRAVGRGAQDYLLKDNLDGTLLGRSIDYAIERKRMEKALFERANHDALTRLANRDMFESRLGMALARIGRSGSGVAVLFIDLDRFKHINDAYGHDAGDETLKTVAQRLKSTLRPYDTAARLGGDEFAVLLEDITNPRDAASISQKIIGNLTLPISYLGRNLEIGASVGIAFAKNPLPSDTLLQYADVAMYHAKKEGGNTYRFYAPDMQNVAEARLKLEEDLRVALAAGELRLYYQPYVAPGGDAIMGIEALLRWANPERGLLMAGEFLPAAEAGRMMPLLSSWIGSQLRRDIAMWNAHALPPLEIALNLSASQLDMHALMDWLAPLAQEDFLGDHRLVVEIPEEALESLTEARLGALAKLAEIGVGLHLDHFGRGSLPLQTLHSLPFALLKLDMSLVQKMSKEVSSDMLLRAAIALAHHLGMKAGAAGVETQMQMDALTAERCDMVQGYLTAHPMTAGELVHWLPHGAQAARQSE